MKKLALAAAIIAAQVAAYAATPSSSSSDLQFTAEGKLVAPAGYRRDGLWPAAPDRERAPMVLRDVASANGTLKKVPEQF